MTTHERLIELVPDIVALKFGCKFQFNEEGESAEQGNSRHRDTVVSAYYGQDAYGNPYLEITGENNSYSFDSEEQIEILGRDITLADVLLAMNLIGHPFEGIKVIGDKMHFDFPTGEEIHFIDPINGTPGTNYEWGHAEWDLKLPFHLQSQETQDFIGRILGVDN